MHMMDGVTNHRVNVVIMMMMNGQTMKNITVMVVLMILMMVIYRGVHLKFVIVLVLKGKNYLFKDQAEKNVKLYKNPKKNEEEEI